MSSSNNQSSSLYNWKDVTSKFRDACTELDIGELIKDRKYENVFLFKDFDLKFLPFG